MDESASSAGKSLAVSGIQMAVQAAGNQSKLAELVGCTPQAISRMVLSGVATCRSMAKISQVTGVPVEKLRPSLFCAPNESVREGVEN